MKLILFCLMLSMSVFSKTIVLEKGNFVYLNGEVSFETTEPVKREFFEIFNKNNYVETSETYLLLNTPGGSVTDGLDMIEFLIGLGKPIPTITIFAASMGFQFAENLGKRYILDSGILMAHKMSGGVKGEIDKNGGQLENRLKLWQDIQITMDKKAAKRSGKSLKDFQKLVENEYWCNGENCIKDGFADEIISLTCGKSLVGAEEKSVKIMLMGVFPATVKGKFPSCPLLSPYDLVLDDGKEEKKVSELPQQQQDFIKNTLGINLKP